MAEQTKGLNVNVGKRSYITVAFRNGRMVRFDADNKDFSDVDNNNVLIMRNGNVIAHLNWQEVLYLEGEME